MEFLWLRRAYQAAFLGLFLYLVGVTSASLIGGYPVHWFLGFDPLVALSTALGTGTLHERLAWSIPLVVLTLVLGRFFCGWICPMGTLHHGMSWLRRGRRIRERVALNLPRPLYKTKYVVLMVMLGMALLGTNQVGWLDPIASTWRALATALVPALSNTALAAGLPGEERHFQSSTVIVALFLVALSLNLLVPRLYCRMLCPLGALLGVLARLSLFRLHRDASLCKDCNTCGADCQGAAEPQGALRVSECMLCLNCVRGCPRGGMRYGLLRASAPGNAPIDLQRRHWVSAALAGAVSVPLLRTSTGVLPRPHPQRIRPPGAVEETEMLSRCIRCGACMKACPTAGLQPAVQEAGLEGLWSPVLVPRLGYCEQSCVLCGQVCPTGAIRHLRVEEKIGSVPHDEPVRIGSALVDRNRCLPWAYDTPCIVCEEVCPTAPKAVYLKDVRVVARDGELRALRRPYVDLSHCVGCGICETRCPVQDHAAIRVTSAGETRDVRNRIILSTGRV